MPSRIRKEHDFVILTGYVPLNELAPIQGERRKC
jgi:hypothetical protein